MKQEKIKQPVTSIRYQVLATIIANLSCLGQGAAVGWTSPSLPLLLSEASPLSEPISIEMAAWIGAILPIGAACGTILMGVVSIFIGSKNSMLLCAFPVAAHWIILYFADEAWAIVIARFLSGLTGGGVFICIPVFVAEIANERVRGRLSSSLQLSFNGGIVLGYIAGSFLSYRTMPVVLLVFPIIFFAVFIWFPSAPQFLLRQNKLEEAEKSLRYYRNIPNNGKSSGESDLQSELNKFVQIAKQNADLPSVQVSDFFTRDAIHGMALALTLMAVAQFCGAFTLSNYAKTVFRETGSNMDPNMSSIVLGSIQVMGTICASSFIDRLGRKMLLLISSAGAAGSLSITGLYSYANAHTDYDLSAYNMLPVVSLSFFIFISAVGLSPVPYVMLSEVLPAKIRRIGATICVFCMSMYAFVMLRYFPVMLATFELHGCMLFFACVSVFGFVFTLLLVKETKGQNLDQLQPVAKVDNVA